MHKLNIYGYHVRYGHTPNSDTKPHIKENCCFSDIFYNNCKSKYYELYILKGDADLKNRYSNYCFFNKNEIRNHLKQIPKFCKMKFRVSDCKYDDTPAYKVNFYIDSNNRTVHKYVMTWVRSLFEWPFNLYLYHARKMKALPEFRFESIINLFNVVSSAYRNSFCSNIHTFGVELALTKKSEIIDAVKKQDRVNYIFKHLKLNNAPSCKLVDNFEDITDELFEKNLPKYIELYHICKYESINNRNQ